MDASELETGDYVAFEELYEIHAGTGDKVLVGEHKDIEDQAQTVHRPQPPKSQTPSRSAKTGDTNEMYIWLGIFAAAAAGALGEHFAEFISQLLRILNRFHGFLRKFVDIHKVTPFEGCLIFLI